MLIFVLKTQISQNLLRSGLIHFQTTSPRCECYPRTWIFYLFGCLCKDQRFLYNTLQYLFYERLETSKGYHLLCQFQTDSFFHVLGRHLSAFGKCFFFFSVYLSWGLWFIKIQQRSAYQKLPFFYLASTIDLFNLTW